MVFSSFALSLIHMKHKIIIPIFALSLLASSCGPTHQWSSLLSSSDTYSYYSTSVSINAEDYGLAKTVHEGEILHAWNWSLQNILSYLPEIAAAGFSTIQTSPMQPQKDYLGEQSWSDAWWKLYQPLGFSIATENHSLGNKDDLIALCREADQYGIKIIVDVVANHLAGDSRKTLDPAVEKYEPEIYRQKLIHDFGMANDDSTKATVQGAIGDYPDLATENPIVQNRVLSLLKEYIDCGVDGFRFDAAKHIETPSDGEYASDFWPTVINGAKKYNEEKGNDELYFYGEILNNVGGRSQNRQVTYYTPYIHFTDTVASDNIRYTATSGLYGDAIKEDIFYYPDTNADNVVLWAESHDTYANDGGGTRSISQEKINKAYIIEASRNDFPSLYFARPSDSATVGQVSTFAWQSKEISEINRFHNQFIGSENHLSMSEDKTIFLNEKSKNGDFGAVIVGGAYEGTSGKVSLPVSTLPDGEYIDRVSGNLFTVNDSLLEGTLGESDVAILYTPKITSYPVIEVDKDQSSPYYEAFDVTISVRDATSSYYQIDNGEEVSFENEVTVRLGENLPSGIIHLRVVARNGEKQTVREYTYLKRDPNHLEITVINIDDQYINNRTLMAWVWKSGEDGRWVSGDVSENTYRFAVTIDDTNFLLASFPANVHPTGTEDVWDQCITQTGDVSIGGASSFDAQSFTWKS